MWEWLYGVMPQTYILTWPGVTGTKVSFLRVNVLYTFSSLIR